MNGLDGRLLSSPIGLPNGVTIKVKPATRKREAYFLEYAQRLKEGIDTPLAVTGGFRSGPAMQAAVAGGATDMVGLARPLALDPDFPNKLPAESACALRFREPTTGFAGVDRMSMLAVTWYEHQLERLSRGKPADPALNPWRVVGRMFARAGFQAFRRRRA